MTSSQVPSVAETRPLLLKKLKAPQLEEQLNKMRSKYKGFGEDLIHWMIAQNNNVEVADIKAGSDGGEGDEVSIAQMETFYDDEDVRATWTEVKPGGKFVDPKSQGQKASYYALPTVAVIDIATGTTQNENTKIDLTVSDGTGTMKCVAYAKAADLIIQAKVKVGSVIRLPLLNVQHGTWTKKGQKGQPDEQIPWFKFSLPQFGSVHKLDLPVTQFLKNLDQVVVKAKDACFVDGIITNLDEQTNEVCTKCFRWYDEKKPEAHKACKGAEIVEEKTFVGTMTTTSSQIHKLFWASNPRQGIFEAKKPKFNVAEDVVRVFGTLTEKNTVMVSGYTVIDAGDVAEASDEVAPVPVKPTKKPVKSAPPVEDEEEAEEDEVAVSPAPKKAVKRVVQAEPEDDEDEDEEDEAPSPPPRRVLRKASPTPEPNDAEEDDEEEEEDEAPSPPPRRKPVAKVPEPEEDDDEDEEEEDEEVVAAPVKRRPVAKVVAKPQPNGEDDEDDAEEEDEEEAAPMVSVKVKAKNGAPNKVTEFMVQALTNFGQPQRVYIIGKSAAKKGIIECEDLEDPDTVNEAFAPHLEAAIGAGAIKYADDKRQKIWLAKGA
jgi:hypothetical protein